MLKDTNRIIITLKEDIDKLKDEMRSDSTIVLESDVKKSYNRLVKTERRVSDDEEEIDNIKINIREKQKKLKALNDFLDGGILEEMKERRSAQINLELSIKEMKHKIDIIKRDIKQSKQSIKILEDVPCGDQFPTCKFIKASHTNKLLIPDQEKNINSMKKIANSIKKILKNMENENLQKKIEKYNEILSKQNSLILKISEQELRFKNISETRSRLSSLLQSSRNELQDMKLRVSGVDASNEISKLRKKVSLLKTEVSDLDTKRLGLSEKSGRIINELRKTKNEYDEYRKIKDEWKIYEKLGQAFSKKGIPLQIIMSQLPIINAEISRILQETVGFTVELEADLDSNAMDVYINYGDSNAMQSARGFIASLTELAT